MKVHAEKDHCRMKDGTSGTQAIDAPKQGMSKDGRFCGI